MFSFQDSVQSDSPDNLQPYPWIQLQAPVKPPYWDESLVDGYLSVTDDEAIDTARHLASKEGIFPGFSGGANVAAAMKLDKTMDRGSIVVTVLPDSGLKYLSSDLYKF